MTTKNGSTALVEVKGKNGELVEGYDYSQLDAEVAKKAKKAATQIRLAMKKTVTGVIEIGQHLLEVKEALGHGKFGDWMKAEFGYSERHVQLAMNVAKHFGSKSATISDLFQPTAAYLLAAPSTPDQAREVAFKEAKKGKPITAERAKEIVAETKGTKVKKTKKSRVKVEEALDRVETVLAKVNDKLKPADVADVVKRLRELADTLEHKDGKAEEKEAE